MEDQGVAELHTLTGLTSLGLAGCVALTERALGHVAASMPALACLKLGGCSRVATITDACLLPLHRLTSLTHLDLAGCLEISDAGRAACNLPLHCCVWGIGLKAQLVLVFASPCYQFSWW